MRSDAGGIGAPSTPGRAMVLALLAFALIAVAGVWLRPPLPVDETRYLSVAWEMHRTGVYLVPHENGALYAQKPPLLFWLINLVWAATGVTGAAARLVGPAFALASLALTGLLAARLWPEVPGVGARAAMILAGFTVFAVYGGLTMFDALLTAATLAGMLALHAALMGEGRARWPLFGAALAFGVLAKGPVILFHVGPALLAYPLWVPAASRPAPRTVLRGAAVAFGVALALTALWLGPAILRGGPAYRDTVLWTQSAGRINGAFGHSRPAWFYLALAPLLLFPWIWSPNAWRALARLPRDEPGSRLCLIWAGTAALLFSLISGKQPQYLLPELPAVALLLARGFGSGAAAPPRWELAAPPVVALAVAALGVALGLLPAGHAAAALSPRPVLVAWALLLLALVWGSLRLAGDRGLVCLGLGLALALNLLFGATAARRLYDGTPIAMALRDGCSDGVAVYGEYQSEFNFLGRFDCPVAEIDAPDELANWNGAHPDGRVLSARGKPGLDWPAGKDFVLGTRTYGLWSDAARPKAASPEARND